MSIAATHRLYMYIASSFQLFSGKSCYMSWTLLRAAGVCTS